MAADEPGVASEAPSRGATARTGTSYRGLTRSKREDNRARTRSLDPAAAEHDVTVVEDDRLAGRDRTLRVIEDNLGPAVVEGTHTSWGQRRDGAGYGPQRAATHPAGCR